LEIPHLSTGDMLRQAIAEDNPVGQLAKSYMEAGHLVPDPVVVQAVCERLDRDDCRRGSLFDGFPRTRGQARALDEYLAGRGEAVDAALDFRVPEDHLVARLAERGRGDDNPDMIRRRFRDFEALTKPLLDYYAQRDQLRVIDGVGTVDEVFERIRAALDK
jgi:adenylate kinase